MRALLTFASGGQVALCRSVPRASLSPSPAPPFDIQTGVFAQMVGGGLFGGIETFFLCDDNGNGPPCPCIGSPTWSCILDVSGMPTWNLATAV